ncbi:hypothetical protein JW766_04600 [Candidatus Dojkabacteria bacterium]|nr:hypothetical protein [Candidatus Dojkabacteria bacterium]
MTPIITDVKKEAETEDNRAKGVELSKSFKSLILEYKEIVENEQKPAISPIHVDELASRIAVFYERIRRIIDWKEEHLIRRFAIERVLKRSMLSQISGISIISGLNAAKMAEPLVMELIRNGYFGNAKISKLKIPFVQKALEKYIYILRNGSPTRNPFSFRIKRKVQFYNWILSIAACEIEEILDPPFFDSLLINFMTYRINERINILPENAIASDKKFYQTYIAVHRTLFNFEPAIITYHLIRGKYPQWTNEPENLIEEFTKNIDQIWHDLEKELVDKYSGHFYKICEQYDTVYLVIGDILKGFKDNPNDIEETLKDRTKLKSRIQEVYDERLSTLRKRVYRSAVYSTLSIFLAGAVSLFIIEVPIAKLVYGSFSLLAILVDILIPTIFMFVLVSLIRLPSKKNFDRVVEEVSKIVYETSGTDMYEVMLVKQKGLFKNCIFGIVFLLIGGLSLGLMYWLFKLANIPWTSIYIDTINIAVIVFAAYVIRQRAREMTVEDSSNFLEFIIDVLSIPIAKIGQWFAVKWQEYNFVSVFFTALIDIPIVKIVQIFEEWRTFLKERRSGLH